MDYCYLCMGHKESAQICPHCAETAYTAPSHHLKPGTILQGKYLVGKALGEGGFGITYIGRDLTLDMKIAIKEYFPNGVSTRNHSFSNQISVSVAHQGETFEKEMSRFLSEARILARFCNNPGVVGVRDFFRENGTAYIVMEYLDGITLKNYLKNYGTIPANDLAVMLDPILAALHEIHNQGLIHRDISPDNIMMLSNGQLKLLDFGAAREVSGNKSMSVMLKPGYAPEEQYRTKGEQGAWTDVYAMCATIYKCITGVTPEESIQRVFEDGLKKPSELGFAIPEAYEQALMQGLCVKSADRIRSIEVLRQALSPHLNLHKTAAYMTATPEEPRDITHHVRNADTAASAEALPPVETTQHVRNAEVSNEPAAESTMYVRHSEATPSEPAVESTMYVRHSEATPSEPAAEATMYVRHSEATPSEPAAEATMYVRHSEATPSEPAADATISICQPNTEMDEVKKTPLPEILPEFPETQETPSVPWGMAQEDDSQIRAAKKKILIIGSVLAVVVLGVCIALSFLM